jgi:hypothetical protein
VGKRPKDDDRDQARFARVAEWPEEQPRRVPAAVARAFLRFMPSGHNPRFAGDLALEPVVPIADSPRSNPAASPAHRPALPSRGLRRPRTSPDDGGPIPPPRPRQHRHGPRRRPHAASTRPVPMARSPRERLSGRHAHATGRPIQGSALMRYHQGRPRTGA